MTDKQKAFGLCRLLEMIQGITMTIYNGIKLSRNVQLNITTFKQIEKNTQQKFTCQAAAAAAKDITSA